jgi:hypothetical protein
MTHPGIAWPPVVGTHVWVKEGGGLGTVVAIEGTGEDRRFIVAVLTPIPSERSCALGDLGPVSWPSARPTGERD